MRGEPEHTVRELARRVRAGEDLAGVAGLSWRLSKNLDFALMAGKLRSLKGDLDTEVLDVGLVYRFNTLESR